MSDRGMRTTLSVPLVGYDDDEHQEREERVLVAVEHLEPGDEVVHHELDGYFVLRQRWRLNAVACP